MKTIGHNKCSKSENLFLTFFFTQEWLNMIFFISTFNDYGVHLISFSSDAYSEAN